MGCKDCFPNKTKLEKILTLGFVMLCMVVVIMFIILMSSAYESKICDNPECVRAATHILDTVDSSVNPCDNFYKFACGNFLKSTFSLGQSTTLQPLQDITKNKLKEIVVENNSKRNISRAFQMQRRFYKNCINETAIEEDNDQTFLKLLDEVIGGWPVVKTHSWVEGDFDWIKTMIKAKRLGLFHHFYFRVVVYSGNESVIWIRPPYKEDVTSFYWKEENIELMSQIAAELGAHSIGRTNALRTTLYFAEELDLKVQKYANNTKENEPKQKQLTMIKDLDHRYLKVDWLNFLKNLTNIPLKEDDLVIFDVEDYFKDLYYVILRTPKKIQANYMAWALISTNIHYMTSKIRNKFKNMQKSVNNTDSNLSRIDLCYKISKNLFNHVAESEYIRRFTPLSKRKYIKEMISNIKTELKEAVESTSWMDKETKSNTAEVLQNITEEIGWTEVVFDAKKFERIFGYHQLKITSDKLVDIARLISNHAVNRYYQQLRQNNGAEEEEEFLNSPKLDVNAFYLKYYEKLFLPAPILQGFVFDEHRPHYLNYGSLGSIIGHEYMHGILDYSIHEEIYDNEFWTNTTSENFKRASTCIIDDYKRYSNLTGFKNDGTVFDENIADFAGINIAYRAYQKWVWKHTVEEKLPGVKYTPNQLFWIMASTYLCNEPRVSEKNKTKNNTTHAVASYRVIGRIKNSPYFASDFNCPRGSFMNPEQKCRIFG